VLTTGALPPIELRLFIAQIGTSAPSSKSVSIALRELANDGNLMAVLRSVVSMTSPESPTNPTLRQSREQIRAAWAQIALIAALRTDQAGNSTFPGSEQLAGRSLF
jgi:hypothetical protein